MPHAREKNYRASKKSATPREIPSTQSGEFVREEIHHIREGKHGARSTKQAIAIGLLKARVPASISRRPRRVEFRKAQIEKGSIIY